MLPRHSKGGKKKRRKGGKRGKSGTTRKSLEQVLVANASLKRQHSAVKDEIPYYSFEDIRQGNTLSDRMNKAVLMNEYEKDTLTARRFMRRMEAMCPKVWDLPNPAKINFQRDRQQRSDQLTLTLGKTLGTELSQYEMTTEMNANARVHEPDPQSNSFSFASLARSRRRAPSYNAAIGTAATGTGSSGEKAIGSRILSAHQRTLLKGVYRGVQAAEKRKKERQRLLLIAHQRHQKQRQEKAMRHWSALRTGVKNDAKQKRFPRMFIRQLQLLGEDNDSDREADMPESTKPKRRNSRVKMDISRHRNTKSRRQRKEESKTPDYANKTPMQRYTEYCKNNGLLAKCRGLITQQDTRDSHFSIHNECVGTDQALALVFAFLDPKMCLESFDLSGNDIRDPGILELCDYLNPELRELNLEANHFGAVGCNALAGIICDETYENFQELHLGNNMLRNAGMELLAEGLHHNRSLIRLNLCRNKIGEQGAEALFRALSNDTCTVRELDVSWNEIRQTAASLCELKCLHHLNLSMNPVGHDHDTVIRIRNSLRFNNTLLHLEMDSCGFSEKDIGHLAKGLEDNHILLGLHLDGLPFEAITDSKCFLKIGDGEDKVAPLTPSPAKSKKHDKILSSSGPITRSISTVRHDCHLGGYSEVSTPDYDDSSPKSLFSSPKSMGKTEFKRASDGEDKWLDLPQIRLRLDNRHPHCWLCGGWSSQTITWKNTEHLPIKNLYIHYQLDGYKAEKMQKIKKKKPPPPEPDTSPPPVKTPPPVKSPKSKSKSKGKGRAKVRRKESSSPKVERPVDEYCSHRVLPPGVQYFYLTYTVLDDEGQLMLENLHVPSAVLMTPGMVPVQSKPRVQSRELISWFHPQTYIKWTAEDEEGAVEHDKEVNYIEVGLDTCINVDGVRERTNPFKVKHLSCVPRPNALYTGEKDDIKWNIELSVFAPRKRECDARDFFDTIKVYTKSFMVDWGLSNIALFIKTTVEQTKVKDMMMLLWSYYPDLVRIFQHYACDRHDLRSDSIFCIKSGSFLDFCNRCMLIDRTLSREQAELIFIKANTDPLNRSKTLQYNNNKKRAMTRYEFLNAVVRICEERQTMKFKRNPGQALEEIFSRFIMPNCRKYNVDNDEFRRKKLYNQAVDTYFFSQMKRLRKLYRKYANDNLGSITHGLIEYKTFCSSMQFLLDPLLTDLELKRSFMNATMVVIDHEQSFKHKSLTFVDFLEAVARLADYKFADHNIALEEKIALLLHGYLFKKEMTVKEMGKDVVLDPEETINVMALQNAMYTNDGVVEQDVVTMEAGLD